MMWHNLIGSFKNGQRGSGKNSTMELPTNFIIKMLIHNTAKKNYYVGLDSFDLGSWALLKPNPFGQPWWGLHVPMLCIAHQKQSLCFNFITSIWYIRRAGKENVFSFFGPANNLKVYPLLKKNLSRNCTNGEHSLCEMESCKCIKRYSNSSSLIWEKKLSIFVYLVNLNKWDKLKYRLDFTVTQVKLKNNKCIHK